MNGLTLAFSRDRTSPVSWIIRLLTWSEYSHVALVSPDMQKVIEAAHTVGVREVPLAEWIGNRDYTLKSIDHPAPDVAWKWARTQLGCKYDMRYLWGFLFRREIQRHSAWACTELINWACYKAGRALIHRDYGWRITPQHLLMIAEPIPRIPRID